MTVRVTAGKGAFGGMGARLNAALAAAARELGAVAEERIKERMATTVDSAGHTGRVNEGATSKAIAAGPVTRRGTAYTVDVAVQAGSGREKAMEVIEGGRKPGKMPPEEPIRRWLGGTKMRNKIAGRMAGARVTLKNRATGKVTGVKKDALDSKLDEVTFLVRRKIGRKGTPGIAPFKKVAEQLRRGEARRIVNEKLRLARGAR